MESLVRQQKNTSEVTEKVDDFKSAYDENSDDSSEYTDFFMDTIKQLVDSNDKYPLLYSRQLR